MILINTKYAIQIGEELATMKKQLDGAQEKYDICQNQWQDIRNAVDDLRKRKARIRVFGKIREMQERGYAGIMEIKRALTFQIRSPYACKSHFCSQICGFPIHQDTKIKKRS